MMSYIELILFWFKKILVSLKNLTYLSFLLNTYNFKILSLCSASIVISTFKIRNFVSLKIIFIFISSDLFHRFSNTKFTLALLFQLILNIMIVVSANFLLHLYFKWSYRCIFVRNEKMHFSLIRWFRVLVILIRTLNFLIFKAVIFISFN